MRQKSIQEIYSKESVDAIKRNVEFHLGSVLDHHKITIHSLLEYSHKELQEALGSAYFDVKAFLFANRNNPSSCVSHSLKKNVDFLLSIQKDFQPFISDHLRPKQREFCINIMNFILSSKYKGGYIHSATGSGKTVLFCEVIRLIRQFVPSSRILIITPSRVALARAEQECIKRGIAHSIYCTGKKDLAGPVTITTRQSLIHLVGSDDFQEDNYSLLISDEAHNGNLGPKTRKAVESFECKRIGFTATPEIFDGHISSLYPENLGVYTLESAIEECNLPRINDSMSLSLNDRFYSVLKKGTRDYTRESMTKFCVTTLFPEVADLIKIKLAGKQMAIFLPSVSSGGDLHQYLLSQDISSAHIHGRMQEREVEALQEKFESQDIQVLCLCEKMLESWDSDVIDGVIILRPTLSPSKYMQMIGRALHGKDKQPDGSYKTKKEVFVIDVVNSSAHIIARNIRSRGLRFLMEAKNHKTNLISFPKGGSVQDFFLYFSFFETINKDFILKSLERYRLLLGEEKKFFYANIKKGTFNNSSQTIDFHFVGNEKFGKQYSELSYTLPLTLSDFLLSLKLLKKASYIVSKRVKRHTRKLGDELKYLKTETGLGELEAKGGVKIYRNAQGVIEMVDVTKMKNPYHFKVNKFGAETFFKNIYDKQNRINARHSVVVILKRFFREEFGILEENIIETEYEYLKTKVGGKELEKNSHLKITRDQNDTIISVDFSSIIQPQSFCLNGVRACVFFQNVGNFPAPIAKSEMLGLLKKFFQDEFGLQEKDFIGFSFPSCYDYLKTEKGLLELEKKSGIVIKRSQKGKIIFIDFRTFISPQTFDINGMKALSFFSHFCSEKKILSGKNNVIEVLKDFFHKEFGLQQSQMLSYSPLSAREYLKTHEGQKELEKNAHILFHTEQDMSLSSIDFRGMLGCEKFEMNGISGASFFRQLGNRKKTVYSKGEAVTIMKDFFQKEFGMREESFIF